MHKLSSGLLRAHTLGYSLTTRPTLVEEKEGEKGGGREREREREREIVHCISHVSLEKAAIR